jgi:hypothetical protein
MLRRKSGSKREEVAGERRRLPNEEVHNLYASPNTIRLIKIKEDEIGRACSTHMRNANYILIGKLERKRPLGRPRRRREIILKWILG